MNYFKSGILFLVLLVGGLSSAQERPVILYSGYFGV